MADDPNDATGALALLRADLPSEQAKARMRARLLATSAFAGAGAALAGSKAMASSAPTSSLANGSLNLLGAKLAALPMAIKVAAIVVAATASASVGIGNITSTPSPQMAAAPLTASKLTAPSDAGSEAPARAAELPPELAAQRPRFAESSASKAEKTHEAIGIRSRRAQRTPERGALEPLPQESSVHDLRQESELLLSALRAIEAKTPLRAEALLAEHERRFGSTSRLTLERNRLRERLHQGAQNPPVQPISEGTSP